MNDKFERFSCEVCGEDNSVEIPVVKEWRAGSVIDVCRNCGFVFVRDRRSSEAIARTWSDEMFGSEYTARIPAVTARHVYVSEFIESVIGFNGKTLCDIGAGEGLFLKNVCDQGFGAEVFGIEPSERNCADMTAASVPCFKGTIEEFLEDTKMADKRFDIVTVMWTLENCRSCRVMVDAAWELLKPNGYIVVATGSRILVPFKKPLHYYISDYSGDTHPSRFSVNSLHNLLASSGFKESHVNRYIDTDYLVVAYQKTEKSAKFEVRKDDYLKVIDFFRRWHKETADYYGDT